MPSSVFPGGMRMSVTTTSGCSASTAASKRVEVAADGGNLEFGLRLEQSPHPLADEVVVVGQHQPDGHSVEDTTVPDPLRSS